MQGQSIHDSFPLSQPLIVRVATQALKGSWYGLQVAKLLLNISKQSGQHQHTLLRLAIVGLEGLAQATSKHQQSTEEEFAAKYTFLQSTADRAKFLDFATTVMLYQPAALLPRVMPTASQNPAEASLSLKTHMLHCMVPKWHLVSQQKPTFMCQQIAHQYCMAQEQLLMIHENICMLTNLLTCFHSHC